MEDIYISKRRRNSDDFEIYDLDPVSPDPLPPEPEDEPPNKKKRKKRHSHTRHKGPVCGVTTLIFTHLTVNAGVTLYLRTYHKDSIAQDSKAGSNVSLIRVFHQFDSLSVCFHTVLILFNIFI